MSEIFLRQSDAVAYAEAIPDQVERVLTEAAMNRAISFLLMDPNYVSRCLEAPLDLLHFTRAIHALFQNKQCLAKVLDGTYRSIDDFDSAF
jgi:hypothetical protein